MNLNQDKIIEIILKHYPNCQAIYIFGSFALVQENKSSDVDIAILLPHLEAKKIKSFLMSDLSYELSNALNKDVDLINLRNTTTVLQNQITDKGICIFCADEYAKNEFEMLALSFYQKLNESRKEILEDILKTKL